MTGRRIGQRLTFGLARALFSYDPASGEIRWRVDRGGGARAGDVAGTPSRNGRQVEVEGRCYSLARIALLLTDQKWPAAAVRFRDGDRDNLRLENIR